MSICWNVLIDSLVTLDRFYLIGEIRKARVRLDFIRENVVSIIVYITSRIDLLFI